MIQSSLFWSLSKWMCSLTALINNLKVTIQFRQYSINIPAFISQYLLFDLRLLRQRSSWIISSMAVCHLNTLLINISWFNCLWTQRHNKIIRNMFKTKLVRGSCRSKRALCTPSSITPNENLIREIVMLDWHRYTGSVLAKIMI